MKGRLGLAAASTLLLAGATYALRAWARTKPAAKQRERVAYPPLDTLKPVGENLWIVDSGPITPAGLAVPIRMSVIRLASGELLLHSPTPLTASLAAELQALGSVRHLIAPSIAHWTFLADWQGAFPAAETWAVPGLGQRPQVRASGLRIDHELGSTPVPWSAEVAQGLVQGGVGFTEAYVFHRLTRTLILTDLVQNLEPSRLPPVTSIAARLARSTCGETPAHVRAVVLLGGEEAKRQVRQLLALEPDKLIFAHGKWFPENAAPRLRQAFDWLV